MGAIVIEGPKWCGKTTAAEQFTRSQLYLADPDKIKEYKILGDASPKKLLEGEKPRLIDEWQVAPKLWDAIRFDVDHSQGFGQYILTGSSSPREKSEISHSGTERFSWVKMRPMSLYESEDSGGDISLSDLFASKQNLTGVNKIDSIDRLAFLTCRGGWPRVKEIASDADSLRVAFEYVNSIAKTDPDSEDEENTRRKTERLRRELRSLARFLFETLCIRDLRVYVEVLDGDVYHYRDKSGLECDAVVHLRNGKYGLIEIKIGGDALVQEGVEKLTSLRNNLDIGKMKEPAFMAVITGLGSYAYQRPEDGVYVVPIGCLKP